MCHMPYCGGTPRRLYDIPPDVDNYYDLVILENELVRLSKQKRKLQQNYGMQPDIHYFDGDMRGIRTYFNYRQDNRLDEFLIDDITWNDLSGDDLFKHINQGLSTPGEQYLYYLLRCPTIQREEYDKRSSLIEMMENNPDLRLNLQVILARLGRRRAANYCEVFTPSSHSLNKAFICILLVIALFFIGTPRQSFSLDIDGRQAYNEHTGIERTERAAVALVWRCVSVAPPQSFVFI